MNEKFKLDIFELLNKVNSGDYLYYSKLDESIKKAFAPLVVQRWLCGTNDNYQIVSYNTFSNKLIFSLGKYPELLYKLLVACNAKKNRRYFWLPIKNKTNKPYTALVIQQYFNISKREIKYYNNLNNEDLLQMAQELGWQKDELSKLEKEIKYV